MALTKVQQGQLTEMLDALRERQLTKEAAAELEASVLADDDARRLYVRATSLWASLHWMHNQQPSGDMPEVPLVDSRQPTADSLWRRRTRAALRFVSRPTPFSITVAACVVGLMITTLALVAAPIYRKLADGAAPSTPQVVARLTGEHEAVWPADERAMQRGAFLLAGHTVQLDAGLAEVTFNSGASIVLEGPATLHVLSANAARLQRGQLSASVPPPAVGFTVETPLAVVKDLGTEFGVSVAADGQTQIGVFVGRVEVELAARDAASGEASRSILSAGQILHIRADGHRQQGPLTEDALRVVRTMPPRPEELRVSEAYIEAVKAAQPAAYWRFDNVQEAAVANLMSPRHALRGVDRVSLQNVGEGNIAALFPHDGRAHFLLCDDMDALAGEAYSIELWAQPLAFDGGQLALLALGRGEVGDSLLLSLHGAIGEPGALRYLHRSPPGKTGGADVQSQNVCLPRQWHHIAAVNNAGRLTLYLDGVVVAEGEGGQPLDPSATNLIVGRLRTQTALDGRPFAGRLDEIAIYNRALSAQEIARRYQLLRGFP